MVELNQQEKLRKALESGLGMEIYPLEDGTFVASLYQLPGNEINKTDETNQAGETNEAIVVECGLTPAKAARELGDHSIAILNCEKYTPRACAKRPLLT